MVFSLCESQLISVGVVVLDIMTLGWVAMQFFYNTPPIFRQDFEKLSHVYVFLRVLEFHNLDYKIHYCWSCSFLPVI